MSFNLPLYDTSTNITNNTNYLSLSFSVIENRIYHKGKSKNVVKIIIFLYMKTFSFSFFMYSVLVFENIIDFFRVIRFRKRFYSLQ